ncbi:glycosyltransferase [Mycobacterium sp. CVI_P3]|uniref:Glycosyltransferase n=1 Tax=Mycobacterium pinniadriaticum TaxID=2994102 RepID=A0ABT3SB60_9MYCO|nr:glycosyltransferase [Mycobacterium pinniadriaticum]MCX2930201.1 glycosyltransferase [Mycobacterium pinniadriaticum]MCX2936737.1 glycosyltransferase [Mycobacterium pinniadriaticum]
MKFAVSIHGTRGDVEPCAAVALELQRRGHDVRMAVPPNLVGFVESAGLPATVGYGPDSQKQLQGDVFERPDALTAASPGDWVRLGNPLIALRKARAAATRGWAEMSDTLVTLTDGADLIVTGTAYQEIAANVAELRGLPLAEVHYFPVRANTAVLPLRLPAAAVKAAYAVGEWLHWRLLKPAETEQRRALGLPAATTRPVARIVAAGALEIQAYDKVFFPGLADEWGDRRPLVGSLTLQLPTEVDGEVSSWIAAGSPPIYFGFGSMPLDSPGDAVRMITDVCDELGERALICAGFSEFDDTATAGHVKLVASVNHAAVFGSCRAVVHHGGAGTTAAGLRAGVPTLVLWVAAEQPLWGKQVDRLGVGRSRRFSASTADSLLDDLRAVLAPEMAERARLLAARMSPVATSVATAADLLEETARNRRTG